MRKKALPIYILAALVLTLFLASCTVTQSFCFDSAQPLSGDSSSAIELDDFFVDVVEELSSWVGTEEEKATDAAIESFAQNLADSKKASDVVFVKTGENSFNGQFSFESFDDLIKVLSSGKNQDIISVMEKGSRTRLDFKINMDNYQTLEEIVPFLSDPNFEVYGPVYNNYLEEQDYLDMISFILGKEGPDSIKASSITIRINTPRSIKSTNAKKVNSNTLEFTFPLIDFLLLHNEISFWCEF